MCCGQSFIRDVHYYKHYYLDFYKDQVIAVRKKLDWTIGLIATLEHIPSKYFKHIEGVDALFEIRTEVGSNIFRIFCFFDKGNLVILLNGFQKKSQKTPSNEIALAEKLKKEYYNEKKGK